MSATQRRGMNPVGDFRPVMLFAGDFPRASEAVQLKDGAVYPAGAVLGKNTATGICELVNSAAADGTEEVFGVLAEEVDCTGGSYFSAAYLTGEFNQNALTFGGSDTVDTHRKAARTLCIFFKDGSRASDA